MTQLAIRNNNPLNIRAERQGLAPWKGQTGEDGGFCTFSSPVYGFRAAAIIITKYWNRGIDNIAEVVRTWAPPSENDTDAYIKDVATKCGWPAGQIVRLSDTEILSALLKAMSEHEVGWWAFQDSDLAQGIALARG